MPAQTRAYVAAVTGNSVDQWAAGRGLEAKAESGNSCEALMANLKQPPTNFLVALQQHVVTGAIQPWGAILGQTDLARKFWIDTPHFSGGSPQFWLDATQSCLNAGQVPSRAIKSGSVLSSRAAANDVCKRIHLAGGDCVVLRNPGS